MMVLSGYSVLGVPVFNQLENQDLEKIEERLDKVRRQLQHTTAKKASHNLWMRHFMENDRDLKHEAFLSLWLCRFVFPPNAIHTVPQFVFPLAIRLARGTRIALAPAVLATIYRDLSWLNGEINSAIKKESVTLWSPLQLVHVWALERFPTLQPNAYRIEPNEPRLAKWHRLRARENAVLCSDIDNAGGSFLWRPYSQSSSLKFFCENAKSEYLSSDSDEDFLSFTLCLWPSELVAMDYIKQYLPHRVAMQFGMNQDIPGSITCFSENHIVAWQNNDKPMMGMMLYIPSSCFHPQVTRHYFEWWRMKLGLGSVKYEDYRDQVMDDAEAGMAVGGSRCARGEASGARMGNPFCDGDDDGENSSPWTSLVGMVAELESRVVNAEKVYAELAKEILHQPDIFTKVGTLAHIECRTYLKNVHLNVICYLRIDFTVSVCFGCIRKIKCQFFDKQE
ncbi:hypothetical protein L6164_031146 [Bauhinia variegata]|uniref:Uncharacterized protein n=1 Tax=Bauhinia variegata TaxID=167791 RepID=A0ACB9LEE0_BAUVA|nr:hypothetical protein L6164_031146 [Bauhinia variegata]